ncbi:MAG: hemolysin family protein [Candidatus Eisenbacteria bacterium]
MIIIVFEILLISLLLALSSCFSGSEMALFSLRAHEVRRLEREPSPKSIRVVTLLKDPHRFLVAILVGNTLVNVAASGLGTNLVSRFFHQDEIAISVAAMSVLVLVFGEVSPKTYALNNPLRVSLALSRFVSIAVRVFGPLKGALEFFLRLTIKPGLSAIPGKMASTGEHASEAIALGHSQGVVDRFEEEVLRGLFKVTHLSVQNVMTPRTEVFMLGADLSLGEATSLVKSSGFSRIPIFASENRDSIVGVLYVKDVLYKRCGREAKLGEAARRPVFVPESKSVVDLMREFIGGEAHFAVVIDEYGMFTGIVTIDDILAEITGREAGKHAEKYSYRKRSRSSWEVSGRMDIDYFNALVGSAVPAEGAETIAGFVTARMGKIPVRGEELTAGNLKLRVLDADRLRIRRILVERLKR